MTSVGNEDKIFQSDSKISDRWFNVQFKCWLHRQRTSCPQVNKSNNGSLVIEFTKGFSRFNKNMGKWMLNTFYNTCFQPLKFSCGCCIAFETAALYLKDDYKLWDTFAITATPALKDSEFENRYTTNQNSWTGLFPTHKVLGSERFSLTFDWLKQIKKILHAVNPSIHMWTMFNRYVLFGKAQKDLSAV